MAAIRRAESMSFHDGLTAKVTANEYNGPAQDLTDSTSPLRRPRLTEQATRSP